MVTYLVAMAMLLGLGFWQLQRLGWKRELLATIDARMAEPAALLPAGDMDPRQWNYRHVTLMGAYLHAREMHVHGIGPDGQPVWRIVTPLIRQTGPAVLVDRGWVPAAAIMNGTEVEIARPTGQIRLSGTARMVEKRGAFVPDNRPADNQWFYIDLAAAARYAQLDALAPLMVVAERDHADREFPTPGRPAVEIPNNHLGYALTWFSLAAVLSAIFLLYHRPKLTDEMLPPA